MTKSFRKLSKRGIKSSLSRFLSIFGIVAIGAGFLAGLMATGPNMRESAEKFYDNHNTYDIEIQSNLGLTKEDEESLKELDYISDVNALHMDDVVMTGAEDENYVTRVFGTDFENNKEAINSFKLVSGTLPKNSNECVIEVPNAYGPKHKIGELLTISTNNEDYKTVKSNYKYDTFKVTGIVKSPLFVSMSGEMSTVGDGTVALAAYVNRDVCKQKAYSTIYATITGAKGLDSFKEEYTDSIKEAKKDLKPFGVKQAKKRHDEIVNKAKAKIKKAEKKYNKNKREADEKLQAAYNKLQSSRNEISASESNIQAQEDRILTNEKKLNSEEKKLDAVKNDIDKLKEMKKAGAPLPKSALNQIKAYDKGRVQIKEGRSQIKNAKSQIQEGKNQIYQGKIQLSQGESQYNSEKKNAHEKFSKAKEKINKAKEDLKDIKKGKWYISDRNDNTGIKGYSGDIDKIAAVATVFPIFFFLIAALVALTTMTRMIEEERLQIGTLKSLGYSNKDILKYYLMYSLIASLGGCILGEAIGFAVLPKVISNAYSMAYNFDSVNGHIIWPLALIISGVIILCILFTTYVACRNELKERPAELMLPKAPQMGKRIWLERITPLWKHIKFTRKVTLRNLFRYKKRFLMTIIGVAGCFALLVAGFGVRDSIGDIVGIQYDQLNHYDISGQATSEEALSKGSLNKVLNNSSYVDKWLNTSEAEVKILGKEDIDGNMVVSKDPSKMKEMITFRQRKSGKKVQFTSDSVLLTEKISEKLNLKVGDTVKIDLKNGTVGKLKVTGVVENYVQNKVYVGEKAANKAFDKNFDYNSLLIQKVKDIKSDTLSENLLDNKDISFIISSETVKKNFEDSIGSIDYIVIVLIISAGALAMVVLYNLTNVNVCERKKELATIKVLGFYEREVSAYIFREINILSVLGMIVGIPLGIALHSFVIRTAEVDEVMFGRSINPLSFLYSFAITLFFTFLVNLIMRKSIKNIDMVESMKAND